VVAVNRGIQIFMSVCTFSYLSWVIEVRGSVVDWGNMLPFDSRWVYLIFQLT
jgi:hypothetical protein